MWEIKTVYDKEIAVFNYSPSDWAEEDINLADFDDTFNVIFSMGTKNGNIKEDFNWFDNPYIVANVYEVVENETKTKATLKKSENVELIKCED